MSARAKPRRGYAGALALAGALAVPAASTAQDAGTGVDAQIEALERAELAWLEGLAAFAIEPSVVEPWEEALAPLPGIDAAGDELHSGTPAPAPHASPERAWDPLAVVNLPLELVRLDHPELLAFLDFYATEGRTRAARWFAAAGRWRAMIERIADEVGAPRDLVWIAAIESGFDPTARSHAGAVGMWQFMAPTATSRGMRIDRWVDERRDPEIATRYALEYLLDRRAIFGNWLIGFAAYNAGSGHARGELREAGATDFFALDDYGALYTDARRYALRALTLAILDRNRTAFGLDGIVPEPAITWDVVEVPGGVRLSLLAEAAGVSTEELRALNPGLIGNQTPPDDDVWRLRIPSGGSGDFVARYDDVADRYGEEHELVAIRVGETFERFADRVGVPARVLRAINAIDASTEPRGGTELLVPTRGRRGATVLAPAGPRLVLTPPANFEYPDRQRVFYELVRGDTLPGLAAHFGVSVWDLCVWNDLDVDATLWSGMTLQVFVAPDFDAAQTVLVDPALVTAVAAGSAEHAAWIAANERAPSRGRSRTHTVRSGDTVGGLAARYGVRASDIVRWNDLDDDARIVIGQQLVVGR
jgi:membrane-bound lytic murein transglycosylase D